MTPTLPVGKRRLRHVAVLRAALGQAVASHYPCICGTATKAQGCVETLVCGGGDGRARPSRLKQDWRVLLNADLWRSLRRRGKRYNKRAGKNAGRGLIPNRIDISERPAIVARKTRLGDWEGDTVVSAGHKGGLLTLVERKTQLAIITKLPRATARATQNAAVRRLKPIAEIRRASGHRQCTENQNLLRHAVSRMGARFK
jgi:hypothetical protein